MRQIFSPPPDQGGDEAKALAHDLAVYLSNRLVGHADDNFKQPLNNLARQIEYGSMNDSLYRIYAMTRDDRVKKVADIFNDDGIFNLFANNPNQDLNGWHANTTIPKFYGAITKYEIFTQNKDLYDKLTPEEQAELPVYKKAAENLWQDLLDHHTFVNGGNSVAEHLWRPNVPWDDATNHGVDQAYGNSSTDENCNIYNMLKLTKELYRLDHNAKYAKYYQWAFTNQIVAAQNPDTGMFAYFSPMDAGYFKVYDTPNLDPDGTGNANAAKDDAHMDINDRTRPNVTRFWCDTGTGMESASKYGDSFYFLDTANGTNDVYVNEFISSTYTGANGFKLVQKSSIPKQDTTEIAVSNAPANTRIRLLLPDWAAGTPVVKVNGAVQNVADDNGYLDIPVSGSATISYQIPMAVKAVAADDNADYAAFTYGPLLLAAKLVSHTAPKLWTGGTNVQSSNYDRAVTNTIVPRYNTKQWLTDITKNLVRSDSPTDGGNLQSVRFKLQSVAQLQNKQNSSSKVSADSVTFQPWYTIKNERYGIYFNMAHTNDSVTVKSVANPEAVQTRVGQAPDLPDTAKVTWSNGTTSDEKIAWENVDPSKYAKAGKFTVNGAVQGRTVTVTVTVTSATPISVRNPQPVTTQQQEPPALPRTAKVTWSDGTTSDEKISWSPIDESQYANPGKFTVRGKVQGLDVTVEVTVVKRDPNLSVDSLAVRRGNVYYIKNSISGGPADRVIGYGKPGDTVLVGKWR
ncbi:beta-L-arabinofuranosidase domain-containing protein [Bifidobacterium catulorum]|nr:beta-L-arabinofuranosidase domain-containing protein [Bifidobacterium catulorum]